MPIGQICSMGSPVPIGFTSRARVRVLANNHNELLNWLSVHPRGRVVTNMHVERRGVSNSGNPPAIQIEVKHFLTVDFEDKQDAVHFKLVWA